MGIDKKLVKLWKENREDMVTALKVLKQLDIIKEQDTMFLVDKLDIAAGVVVLPTKEPVEKESN